jgi:hypothetical protein
MLPNRSKLNRSSPGGSDGTREANCKLCLCASADWRWLVFASEDFSNGCSTCGLSWTPGNSGGGDNRAWWVFAVGGLYQGPSERLARVLISCQDFWLTPHRRIERSAIRAEHLELAGVDTISSKAQDLPQQAGHDRQYERSRCCRCEARPQ